MQNHIRSYIGFNFEELFFDYMRDAGGSLGNLFFNSICDWKIFKLIKCSVKRNVSLTEIEISVTHSTINVSPVSLKSLQKYILSLILLAEDTVRTKLLEKFWFMLEVLSDNLIHYVAFFCFYMHHEKYKKSLFRAHCCSKKGTWAHNSIMILLESRYQCMERHFHVLFLAGDNCSVNQHLATILHCYFWRLQQR